jgi:Flp pilus assembly pilin Flp
MKQPFCKHGEAARRRSRLGARKVTEVPKLVLRALSTKAPLRSDEQGQTFAEYAVALTAITIGILAALIAFSEAIQAAFQIVNDTVSGILH